MDDITEMILSGARCQTCGGIIKVIKAASGGPVNCLHCDTMEKEDKILLGKLLRSFHSKV